MTPPTANATFVVSASEAAFADKPITIAIWDHEQLAILAESAACNAASDQDGKTITHCPPGVTYREPAPEERSIVRADLAKPITITSRSVAIGEHYRVTIRGVARDGCNTAMGSTEGEATATVEVKLDQIAQTLMGCTMR